VLSLQAIKQIDMFLKFLSIFLIIIFIIPYLLRSVLRFLFGSGNPQQNRPSQSNGTNASSRTQKPPSKKKVISKSEGEYVDYEVVKD